MFAVLPMHVTADDVIDVPVVRNREMFASDTVHVIFRVRVARMAGIAADDVVRSKLMFVDVVAVRMVQVPVVHVIHMILVADGKMTACVSVQVFVPIVNVRFHVVNLVRSGGASLQTALRTPLVTCARTPARPSLRAAPLPATRA